MDIMVLFFISFLMGLLAFSLIAKWYVWPYLQSQSREDALIPLLLLHTFRYIGLSFLIPTVVTAQISIHFAYSAGYGDLLAALLAFVAIAALRMRWSIAMLIVWVFNIVGVLDFLNAFYLGLTAGTPADLGAAYYIPIVIVPALLVAHYLIFALLLKKD